jgi:HlyD family secretion protein
MKLKLTRKRLILPAILIVGGLVAWGLIGARRDAKAEYRMVEVTRGDVRATVSSTGTLQAIKTVAVGTQVSGKISEIFVDFNDRVTEGQLIARIDPVLLEQAVSSAEADVERSEAQLAQAQSDLDRIERLFQREVATESERVAAQYSQAIAKAGLKSAKVNLERARQNLSYSEIRSPISGIVLSRTVDAGQTVAASFSAPQLVVIAEDLSAMEILASVDESDIGKIVKGQPAEFTVQAYPDDKFTGAVSQIRLQPTAQENVVSYTVVISVANPDGRLLPGMTATVDFIVAEATDIWRVPNAALRFRPTTEMLASARANREERIRTGDAVARRATGDSARNVLRDAGEAQDQNRARLWYTAPDGKPASLSVVTGITDGQLTEIRSELLSEGMQVIASVTTATAASGANPFETQTNRSGRPGPPPGM